MRMMTGAILILASAILYSTCELKAEIANAYRVYSTVCGVAGWLLLAWGLVLDIMMLSWRRHRRKGDA